MIRLVKLCLAGALSAEFSRCHANRMFECCSTIVQYTTPISASPMKAALSDNTGVDKTNTIYSRAGIPSTSVSILFQRTVKYFSFVTASLLYAHRFTNNDA
jgi:hypothetical protein